MPSDALDLSAWAARLLATPDLCRMGHNQRAADGNLGLGWLYYALARIVHPSRAVVIGSHRGFVPLMLGRALRDSAERGDVWFIDPSMVDDFWTEPDAVRAYFASHGLDNVRHFKMTTQEFAASPALADVGPIGLLFVDGFHTAEQARFDFETFAGRLEPRGLALFHDSMIRRPSGIYGTDRVYDIRVRDYMEALAADPAYQVFDLPFGTGLTLVRKLDERASEPRLEGEEARV